MKDQVLFSEFVPHVFVSFTTPSENITITFSVAAPLFMSFTTIKCFNITFVTVAQQATNRWLYMEMA